MFGVAKLVRKKRRRSGAIEMASVCQCRVVICLESELAYAVRAGVSIDPEEQIVICTDANGNLVLRWPG
jgi:hypothetical protein